MGNSISGYDGRCASPCYYGKTVKDGVAVWAESENGEVIDIVDGVPILQGYGKVCFHMIKNGVHMVEYKFFVQKER